MPCDSCPARSLQLSKDPQSQLMFLDHLPCAGTVPDALRTPAIYNHKPAQGHTAGEWRSQDSSGISPSPRCIRFPVHHLVHTPVLTSASCSSVSMADAV